MNYAAFKDRRRELLTQFHDTKDSGDHEGHAIADEAIVALEREHSRLYDLDDRYQASISVGGFRPWLQVRELDEEGRVNLYSCEFGALPSGVMRQLTDAQELVERYIAGEIDELPERLPSPRKDILE